MNFQCLHKNQFELRLCSDFECSEEAGKNDKICESFVDAMQNQTLHGIGYWNMVNGIIKSAQLNKFAAECPKVDCGGGMIETESSAMLCEKCNVLYNAPMGNLKHEICTHTCTLCGSLLVHKACMFCLKKCAQSDF